MRKMINFKVVALFLMLSLCSGCVSLKKIKVVDHDPKNNPSDFFQSEMKEADQLYALGSLEKAESIYSKLAAKSTQEPIVYYRLGNIAFKKESLKKAEEYYEKTLALVPANAKAHFNIAIVHLMLAQKHFQNYNANIPPGTETRNIQLIMQQLDQFMSNQLGSGAGSSGVPSSAVPAQSAKARSSRDSSSDKEEQDHLDSLVKELQGL